MRTSSCATSRPWRTSSGSRTTDGRLGWRDCVAANSQPLKPHQRRQPAAAAAIAPAAAHVRALRLPFDAANSIPRRVPVPVLRPPLNICKPTGVTLAPARA